MIGISDKSHQRRGELQTSDTNDVKRMLHAEDSPPPPLRTNDGAR